MGNFHFISSHFSPFSFKIIDAKWLRCVPVLAVQRLFLTKPRAQVTVNMLSKETSMCNDHFQMCVPVWPCVHV